MRKIVNRRARYDYELLEKLEVGIALTGPEVKSVKAGQIDLNQSFVRLREGEAWLHNAHVHPYKFADNRDYDPTRARKLLLHKKELLKFDQQIKQKRLTLVPVSCYTKGRQIKLEIALARPKKEYEKRAAIKKRDLDREIESQLREKGT